MDLLRLIEKRLETYESRGDTGRAAKLREALDTYKEMRRSCCKYWKDQPDSFHGLCMHPEARQGEPCILNTEDECLLREESQ